MLADRYAPCASFRVARQYRNSGMAAPNIAMMAMLHDRGSRPKDASQINSWARCITSRRSGSTNGGGGQFLVPRFREATHRIALGLVDHLIRARPTSRPFGIKPPRHSSAVWKTRFVTLAASPKP